MPPGEATARTQRVGMDGQALAPIHAGDVEVVPHPYIHPRSSDRWTTRLQSRQVNSVFGSAASPSHVQNRCLQLALAAGTDALGDAPLRNGTAPAAGSSFSSPRRDTVFIG